MNIITLTLNPAFDTHCTAENFAPFHENFAEVTSHDAGGKGINISRALTANGIPNLAYVVVGDQNGNRFLQCLERENIVYKSFTVPGRIRENITLHTPHQPETRISFSGFTVDENTMNTLSKALIKEDVTDTVVTLTGSLPNGMAVEHMTQLLIALQKKGARLVLDSRSFGKADVLAVRPWLLKPNQEEIAMYTDIAVNDVDSAAEAAKKLRQQGVENVMISLGSKGAVLCCEEGVFLQPAPPLQAVSTVGAGDSAIAGFLAAVSNKLPYKTALQYAVAYGSAACLREGTAPPKAADIQRLLVK